MPDRCPKCHRPIKRSNEANARYWLLLHKMAEVIKTQDGYFSAEVWHNYCKSKWLGMDEIKMPNRKSILVPKSTSDLDKVEFNDYMTKVESWAIEHGAYLEDLPD